MHNCRPAEKAETTTCFSICERRSPSGREILRCQQRRTDQRRYPQTITFLISIYTLSDLGDLSDLIGSLSRTIQQYSPPREWIMCELGVFPIFLENDLLKVDKILGLTFFKARTVLEGFNTRYYTAFFNLL